MINFKTFQQIQEAVSMSKAEFLTTMTAIYDSGDERLINKITELGTDLMIDDVVEEIFKVKLPKAEGGAKETLSRMIKQLNISADDKVKLAQGIMDGTAYDIPGLARKTWGTPGPISSCVNTTYPGAMELLPWYVEWKAKADKGTRGAASTEIFMISAGKNGRTPPKGDCMVDGVTIESKSDKNGFGGEFSISGKQSSYLEPTANFRELLKKQFEKAGIKIKDDSKHGLGDAKKSGALTGGGGAALTTPMEATIGEFRKAGWNDAKIQKMLADCVNGSFPAAKGLSTNFIKGGKFDAHEFMILWNAAAFAEYKHEEGFKLMMMFNRKAMQCVTFMEPVDIIKLSPRIKPFNISYNVGIGQNKSIGGFALK